MLGQYFGKTQVAATVYNNLAWRISISQKPYKNWKLQPYRYYLTSSVYKIGNPTHIQYNVAYTLSSLWKNVFYKGI